MVARFLHYYPQYKLSDFRSGALSGGEFFYLWAGMLDNENPAFTEPPVDAVARKTREIAEREGATRARGQGGF